MTWDGGPRVRASPASLCCGPWARHIYPSLVLVQPRKARPCLTERLLMGHKESNQQTLFLDRMLLSRLAVISECLLSSFTDNPPTWISGREGIISMKVCDRTWTLLLQSIEVRLSICITTDCAEGVHSNPTPCRAFLAHLSGRLMGELIVYQSLRCPSVRHPSVNIFKHLLLWNHWAN